MRGPIDYIVVGFDGNNFDGSMLRELGAVIDQGIIDLVSLAVVSKDEAGNVTVLDIANLGDEYIVEFGEKYAANKTSVDADDIDEIGDLLVENSTAALLVIEQLWAKPLKAAIINANGFLVAEGRIHPEAAEALNEGEA